MTMFLTRRTVLGAAVATTALTMLPRGVLAAPAVGAAAPDFELPDQDGALRKLSSFKGKVVVLEWINHDCPYVRKHYNSENMQALQREAGTRGLVWLTIASSPKGEQGYVTGAEAKALSEKRKAAPTTVILDHNSKAARLYQATTTPQMVVIDKDGVLRYYGGIDSIRSARLDDVPKAEPYFKNAMIAVAEGRTPERTVAPPYGCTIKYVGV
jgi:peroxiredoxin